MAEEYVLYRYSPSLVAAILAIIVFTVLSALHTYRMIRSRLLFCLPFTIGGICKYKPYLQLKGHNARRHTAKDVYLLQSN